MALLPGRIDLNLLKVFRAVYETGQTTAAAQTLGLTQPAVSQALGRLRTLTADPLFVATRAGMEPTARAHELARTVLRALDDITGALERAPAFNPATARRRFRIGMLDYGVMTLAPALAREISTRAPGIALDISHTPAHQAPDMLLADQLDIATGPFDSMQNIFIRRPLFEDVMCVVARRKHPQLRRGLDLPLFAKLGHVDVSYARAENERVDKLLRQQHLSRTRAISTAHFVGALHIVGASDLISVAPRRLALTYRDICGLELHQPPLPLPALRISSAIHRRNESDAGLAWLQTIMAGAAKAFGDRFSA